MNHVLFHPLPLAVLQQIVADARSADNARRPKALVEATFVCKCVYLMCLYGELASVVKGGSPVTSGLIKVTE